MNQRRILLIEDNENNRYLVSFLLQAHGWEVVHAADGPRGIALAAQVSSVHVGGIGTYTENNFVHADVGRARRWNGR